MYRVCLVFFCQIITRLIPLFLPVFLLLMIRNEMRVVFNDSKNGLFLHCEMLSYLFRAVFRWKLVMTICFILSKSSVMFSYLQDISR